MSRLANSAFLLSLIGAAYQFIAPTILLAVEPNRNNFYYYTGLGLGFPAFLGLVVFWAASQLLKDPKISWPTIISVIGFTGVANLIIISSIPTSSLGGGILGNSSISATGLFILILSPVLILVGGIFGIIASRRYSRQEKHTVTQPATSQSKLT